MGGVTKPLVSWMIALGQVFESRPRRGKSGLPRTAQGITSLHRKVRNSGTERMSRALISESGTGGFEGAAGVKTAKLCVEQDQIGELNAWSGQGFRVRSLEGGGNIAPREMIIHPSRAFYGTWEGRQNPAYSETNDPNYGGFSERKGPLSFFTPRCFVEAKKPCAERGSHAPDHSGSNDCSALSS